MNSVFFMLYFTNSATKVLLFYQYSMQKTKMLRLGREILHRESGENCPKIIPKQAVSVFQAVLSLSYP